jgi:gliding motility-associated-like protein
MKYLRATLSTILVFTFLVNTIYAQGDIQITNISSTPVSCYGFSDGTITVDITGGSGLYNYLLLRETSLVESAGPLSDLSYTFTNLESYGPYFIFVIDEASSEGDSAYDVGVAFVSGPDPINVTSATATSISCNNANDGSISVRATGEYGNHIFELSGPMNSINNDGDFSGLIAGDYTVTVTDQEGCPSSDVTPVLTIINPPLLSISVDDVTDAGCYDEASGSIAISPFGGTPGGGGTGYTYAWTGPGFSSNSEDLVNILAGDYFVTVYDANACEANDGPITVNEPPEIIMAVDSITDVTCNGTSDGAIYVTVSGGAPGYTFEWSGPSGIIGSTEDITALSAGDYQLTVTDATGCEQIMQVLTVNEPPPLAASALADDISCFGLLDGAVDLTVSGGTAPYLFAWTGPNGFTAATEDISGLEAGDYNVTVTDSRGCFLDLPGIASIMEPTQILVSTSSLDISCNGQTDGSITTTVSGGTGPYRFTWTGPSSFSSSDQDIFGLGPGIYSLDVEDANGCILNLPGQDTIVEPAPITITFRYQIDPSCYGVSDGSIVVDISGGTSPLTFNWTDSAGITVSNSQNASGLAAGPYSLSVTDDNGCSASRANVATLVEPSPIVSILSATDVTCFGATDGTITVTSSGGTGPYEYSINGDVDGSYQSGQTFTSLAAGTYTIWTRDDNFCVISNEITLVSPDSIEIGNETVSGTILCNGDSTAGISIGNVTGGNGPYNYSINGGMDYYPSGEFSNLPAGNYQTVVRDSRGCTQPGQLHQIDQPSLLRINDLQVTDVTGCFDSDNGILNIDGQGGTGTITFTVNGTLTNTTGIFPDLASGVYLINLEDENGCTADSSASVQAPDMIMIDSIEINDVTGCFGDTNGSVRVTASGGTPQLRFSLDGVNFNASGNFNGLPAGDYTLTVRDDNGCTVDSAITITQPAAIAIVSQEVSGISCAGAADGTITIVASGGTAPLEYTLMPDGTTNEDGIFNGLGPDIYTVLVADAAGCPPVASTAMILTEPSPLLIDSIVESDLSCNGAGDGSITVYGSGGIAPYQYSVDNQASWSSDSLFTGLAAGPYEVFIRDSNLCITYGGTVTLDEPPPLSLAIAITDVSTCSYDSTGIIVATGAGGTGALFYSLDGSTFQDSGTFADLPAGAYTVLLRDETGCFTSMDDTIRAPEPVFAVITKTDAISEALGSITISGASGGTPPYEYTINGPAGPFSPDTAYTGLAVGTYHVIVMDLNLCIYEEMVEIVDVPPLEVSVSVTNVSCFGAGDGSIEMTPLNAEGIVEYSIDSGLNFAAEPLFENLPGDSTYYLMVRDGEGKMFTDSATISEPTAIVLSSSITPAECNAFSETGSISITVSGGAGGYSFLWSDGSTEEDRTNLVAGTYELTTTDANGCIRSDTLKVGSLINVIASAGEDTAICFGGSLQLNGQGGEAASWDPSPFLSDPAIHDPVVTDLTEETTFVLTITEETSPFGCYNKDSIHVTLYPNVGVEVTPDTVVMSGMSIQLEASGGPFSAYRWEPALWLDNSAIPDPIATPQDPVRYWVFATNEYGCEETDSVFIDVIEDLKVYNVFSPNGDGVNDYFEIDYAENFPDMRVEIYSRWGDLLYSTVGYDSGSRWDGTTRGTEAPVGTYYYIIIPYSGARPITGNVTIIR